MKAVIGFGVLALLAALTGFTIDLTIIFGSGSEVPGPSLALFNAQKYYSCTNNRYVSTTGNGANNGLTVGTPWDLATAVAYSAPAGTCINVASGSYNVGSGIAISHGGTSSSKTGYVVWRCQVMPFSFSGGALQGEGNGCVMTMTAGAQSFNNIFSFSASTSYVMFEGFEFDGASLTAEVCINTTNSGADATTNHHIWSINNDLHHCNLGGIVWDYTDWLFVIHNVWHDNAGGTNQAFCGSGLSFFEPIGLSYTPTVGNPDYWHSATTGRTYNMVVIYNFGYHNFNANINCFGTGGPTDGEGIIMDTFDDSADTPQCSIGTGSGGTCPYNGNALIMGNIMYGNGGNGIEAFSMFGNTLTSTAHIDVINNTTYSNGWDPNNTGTFGAGLLANFPEHVTWWNNIAITVTGSRTCVNTGFACSALDANGNSTDSWLTNMTYPSSNLNFANGATYPTVGGNHNVDGTDPKLTSLTPITARTGANSTGNSNFALQAGSPALGFGQAFDLWQQSGTVDAGACVSGLAHCP